MQPTDVPQPLFEPQTLNFEFIFQKIYDLTQGVFDSIFSPHFWGTIGTISIVLSIIFLTIIIFSLVRIREIQLDEKRAMEDEINEALKKEEEKNKNENPKWHYVLTLIESSNESDWRVSIIEADSILEETLKNKGIPGETVGELLENARSNGYNYIQDAWDAHLVRNQIAHADSDFSLSQFEARRTIRMFQNFLEELGVI